jgi:hypothetical protein
MRVCLGLKPTKDLSAGGGVKFAIDMEKYLTSKNVKVEYFLDYDNPPDVLLMFDYKKYKDPRLDKFVDVNDVKRLKYNNFKTKVIHRVNDTGVVYVSDFTKNHFEEHVNNKNHKVILNGVDKEIFGNKQSNKNNYNILTYELDSNIKLVTHHFSTNKMKGWDIYQKIDSLVGLTTDIEFTVIGNIPSDVQLKNTRVVEPKQGKELAEEIRKHNVYVTASRYEACGMHYLEGVSCGLPLLYHEDGGGVEHMKEYGKSYFDMDSFIAQLYILKCDYYSYYKNIELNFDLYSDKQCEKYYNYMLELVNEPN